MSKGHGYKQRNSFQNFCSKSKQILDEYLRRTANFVEICGRSEELLSVDYVIESYALRRKLAQKLGDLYRD
jgi:hypothetical protein